MREVVRVTAKRSIEGAARKTRPDAWWAALSEEECWEVWEKFRRLPWHAVAMWLRKEKGLAVSRSALYRFGDWIRPQESARRLEMGVLARREAEGLAKAAGANEDVARAFIAMGTEVGVRTQSAEAASGWIKMAAALLAAAQKDAELRLREEAQKTAAGQLRLAQEKFEAQQRREDAAKGVIGDAKLSPEERDAKLKEIFGIG